MATLAALRPMRREARSLIELVKGRLGSRAATDPSLYAWYSDSCPHGLPPGECRVHPRARPSQRPPQGDWRTFLALAGRGWGKTRCGAEWVRSMVETGQARRVALVAATADDARAVMVEGESGILAICPPSCRPRYEPSRRRLTWPSGAIATTYSAEEPDRLRGPQHDLAWIDEISSWKYPATFDNLLLGLRLGKNPRVLVTTTPRPTKLLKRLIAEPTTVIVKGSTYENRPNLAETFFSQIVSTYEGTRLGQQEIYAEILETSDGAWFATFDGAKHVATRPLDAEYSPMFPVHLAIDCGVSRHTGAVWFQVRPLSQYQSKVTVFADFHCEGPYSEAAAKMIRSTSDSLPSRGRIDTVRLDPASTARTGIGPAAFGEFERVFGSRVTEHWPTHRVADGLDQLELLLETGCLLLHPRCTHLKAAFQNYARTFRGGEWLDIPADPQHPHEDLLDALRGGVRDRFPEGRPAQTTLRNTPASRIF